jgi:4'-phosphopantetheinyl transferase EntD
LHPRPVCFVRLTAARPQTDGPNWDRLLFSAKEAVYKAWFPLVGDWLDHQEAEILFDPERHTFAALLYRDGLIVDGRLSMGSQTH